MCEGTLWPVCKRLEVRTCSTAAASQPPHQTRVPHERRPPTPHPHPACAALQVKAKEELSACPLCRAPLFRCASAKQTLQQEGEELQPEAGAAQERGQAQADDGLPAALAPTAPSSSSSSSASSSSATSEGWSRAGSMALMDDGAGGAADLAGDVELTAAAAAAAAEAGAAQSGRAGRPVGSFEGSTAASAAAAAGAMQA